MRFLRIGLVLGLLVTASACGGDDDTASTTTATSPATTEPATTTEPTSTTATTPSSTTTTSLAPPSTTAPPTTSAPPATTAPPAPPTTEPATIDVKIYLLREERLAIAHREVVGPAVLRGALEELLDGPSAGDSGLHSEIPTGTALLDLNLADGLATVDLSADFETGGGSLSMLARITQVVFTATQFPNVDQVLFWLEGEPIDFLGGEGIVLDEPQSRMLMERSFTGGILIDLPTPGSTVTSPFTVTGEGDVYEGDFPIEIWRDGAKLGDTVIVRAGAWGTWADFEATVTLDVAPGPIELVAYDEGGCGDAPECPPIITTVVPLTLAG